MTAARIDFETKSLVDLKKSGSHRYAGDPSTKILCMSWAIADGPISSWRPGQPFPQALEDHIEDPANTVEAWNAAGFERLIWLIMARDHRAPHVRDHQWRCTMIRAAYWGLPMSLDLAAKALKLSVQKDMEGHRLMLQMCKPRNAAALKKGTETVPTWWDQEDPAKLDRLCAYCSTDVDAEREVGRYLPPLPDAELRAWQLDTKINEAGWMLDDELIARLDVLTALELSRLNTDMRDMTLGFVSSTGAVAKLLAWVNARRGLTGHLPLAGLDKETLAAAITEARGGSLLQEVLLIRQEAAKSSTAKLQSMLASVCWDGAVRGLTQFYGASRTGRWAGRLVQIQNLPRPVIKQIREAIERIREFADPGASADWLRDFLGVRPLDAVSSVLRGCFVPRPGKKLVVGDFAQIEARVIAWLAGQQDILDVFASGEDVYVYTANKMGSTNRQLGKVIVLACGFGMGPPKFQATAKTYGLDLSDEEAEEAVHGYRASNPMVKKFWYDCERAARDVIEGKCQFAKVGRIQFALGRGALRGCLLIQLPSGRLLTYREVRMAPNPAKPEFGDQITYEGVNQTTKRWETLTTYGGKLAENVTQAVARDLLSEALLRLDHAGAPILATIHDEAVTEAPADTAHIARGEMERIMRELPAWAQGLPVGADVKVMERYGK